MSDRGLDWLLRGLVALLLATVVALVVAIVAEVRFRSWASEHCYVSDRRERECTRWMPVGKVMIPVREPCPERHYVCDDGRRFWR